MAEAVTMAWQAQKKKSEKFFVLEPLFPQSLAVLKTRCQSIGLQMERAETLPPNLDDYFCVVIQYPNAMGAVGSPMAAIKKVASSKALCLVAADLLSLGLIQAPGKEGADIVVGSTQRFGVPMGFGGPHAAYLATRNSFKRLIPGRIVGVSKDSKGKVAYRLALQTREQHIRREKATSNICTAQVLLAVMAGFYGVYHGPRGLKAIAEEIHSKACKLAQALCSLCFEKASHDFFDTLFFKITDPEKNHLIKRSRELSMNFNFFPKRLGGDFYG